MMLNPLVTKYRAHQGGSYIFLGPSELFLQKKYGHDVTDLHVILATLCVWKSLLWSLRRRRYSMLRVISNVMVIWKDTCSNPQGGVDSEYQIILSNMLPGGSKMNGYLQLVPIGLRQSTVQPGKTCSINTQILLVQKCDSRFAPRGLPNCFP